MTFDPQLQSGQQAHLNNLAWYLVTTSNPAARNPTLGLDLARKAVDLAPESWQSLPLYRDWLHSLRDAMIELGACTKAALELFITEYTGRFQNTDLYVESTGEDRYRRGLYTFIRRTVRYPSLTVFDAPSHETSTVRRPRSNTPLQALTTLNDPAFFEAAKAMGQRIVNEGGADVSSRATYGFRLVMSRRPSVYEVNGLVSAFETERQYFQSHQAEARSVAGKPDVELAAWTMVSNALLNLDGTITKE